jgi:hypothetical protein
MRLMSPILSTDSEIIASVPSSQCLVKTFWFTFCLAFSWWLQNGIFVVIVIVMKKKKNVVMGRVL